MTAGDMKDTNATMASDAKIDEANQEILHSSEADVGYELFWQNNRLTRDEKDGSIDHEKDWETDSKNLLRKIDRRILPIMCVT
jgi:hypothetical protein